MKTFMFGIALFFLFIVIIVVLTLYLISVHDNFGTTVRWENIPICPMLNQPLKQPLDESGVIMYCENCKREYNFFLETHLWISKNP